MDYYILNEDKEYTDVPKTINWFGRIDVESIYKGEYSKLEKAYVLEIKENQDIYIADTIIEPVFAVSKMVKFCIETYEPNIEFTNLYFVQRKEQKVFEYFIPHLTLEDCVTLQESKNNGGIYSKKLLLDTNRVEADKFIFMVRAGNENHIIARTEFLESLLRRSARGMHIEKIEIA